MIMKFMKNLAVLILFVMLTVMSVNAENVSGTLSNGVSWTLNVAGELLIYGDAEVPDVGYSAVSPWKDYIPQIKGVILT